MWQRRADHGLVECRQENAGQHRDEDLDALSLWQLDGGSVVGVRVIVAGGRSGHEEVLQWRFSGSLKSTART